MKEFEISTGADLWFYNKSDSAHGQQVRVVGWNDDENPEFPLEVTFENDGEPYKGFVKASELRNHPVDSKPVAKIRTAITMLKTMNDGRYPEWVFSQVGKDAAMVIAVLEDGLKDDANV